MQEEGTIQTEESGTTSSDTETVVQTEQTVNVQTSNGTVLSVDELKTETVFETAQGTIHLVHEMTLGDVVVTMFLMFILIFHILDRFIRR